MHQYPIIHFCHVYKHNTLPYQLYYYLTLFVMLYFYIVLYIYLVKDLNTSFHHWLKGVCNIFHIIKSSQQRQLTLHMERQKIMFIIRWCDFK